MKHFFDDGPLVGQCYEDYLGIKEDDSIQEGEYLVDYPEDVGSRVDDYYVFRKEDVILVLKWESICFFEVIGGPGDGIVNCIFKSAEEAEKMLGNVFSHKDLGLEGLIQDNGFYVFIKNPPESIYQFNYKWHSLI